MMRTKKDVDTRISRLCQMALTSEAEMEELGSSLLETFHDVCRYNTDAANNVVTELCYGLDGGPLEGDEEREMSQALVRLEWFATESRRDDYQRQIERILQTGWMIRIMEALRYKVYNFGKYGPEYVDILNTCYMNSFDYTMAEASEVLNMGESTLYRKKRRAVILFGLAFLEFKANNQPGGMPGPFDPDGVQLRMPLPSSLAQKERVL